MSDTAVDRAGWATCWKTLLFALHTQLGAWLPSGSGPARGDLPDLVVRLKFLLSEASHALILFFPMHNAGSNLGMPQQQRLKLEEDQDGRMEAAYMTGARPLFLPQGVRMGQSSSPVWRQRTHQSKLDLPIFMRQASRIQRAISKGVRTCG